MAKTFALCILLFLIGLLNTSRLEKLIYQLQLFQNGLLGLSSPSLLLAEEEVPLKKIKSKVNARKTCSFVVTSYAWAVAKIF